MNFKTFCFSLFIILSSYSSFSQVDLEKDIPISKEDLLRHIQTLSSDFFEGRETGTDGGIKTRKYIINQFYSLGVKPLGDTFEQNFLFVEQRKEYQAANIVGWIKGSEQPDRYVVISAHYDHEGIKQGVIYNGADDNASGVCALFSFADYFKKNPPKHSVILAAFDGEEFGLKGANYFVKNSMVPLQKIKVNLNMDMISRSANNELFIVGTRYSNYLKQLISNLKFPDNIIITMGHDGDNGQENWTYSSDHAAFYRSDIPFLYFGVEDHEDYHMPTDDFENIQPDFYVQSVKSIIYIFDRIDSTLP